MFAWFSNLLLPWKLLLVPSPLFLTLLGVGTFALLGGGTYPLQTLRAIHAAVAALISGAVRQAEVVAQFNAAMWAAHARLYKLTATAANETDQKKVQAIAEQSTKAMAQVLDSLSVL